MATQTQKIREEILFNGGIDSDSEDRFMVNGDYRDAKNVIKVEDESNGILVSMKGNTDTYSLGVTGTVVGAYEDTENGYYYVWVAGDSSYIVSIKKSDGSVSNINLTSKLNCTLSVTNYVKSIKIGDIVVWNDSNESVRRLNVDYLTGVSTLQDDDQVLSELLKKPPLFVPEGTFLTDSGSSAVLKLRVFQFACMYVYEDGEESVYSPFAKAVFTTLIANNAIGIKFKVEHRSVDEVRFAVREGQDGDWVFIGKVDVNYPKNVYQYDATKSSVQDLTVASSLNVGDTEYYWIWKEQGYQLALDQEKVNKWQDDVPQKANTIESIDKSRLALGGITNGYANPSGNADFTISVTNNTTQGKTFKYGAEYGVGIVYRDSLGRVGTVYASDDDALTIDGRDDRTKTATIKINHSAPSWAAYGQVVLTKSNVIDFRQQTMGRGRVFCVYKSMDNFPSRILPGVNYGDTEAGRWVKMYNSQKGIPANDYATGEIALGVNETDFATHSFQVGDYIRVLGNTEYHKIKDIRDSITVGYTFPKLRGSENWVTIKYDYYFNVESDWAISGKFLILDEVSDTVGLRAQDGLHLSSMKYMDLSSGQPSIPLHVLNVVCSLNNDFEQNSDFAANLETVRFSSGENSWYYEVGAGLVACSGGVHTPDTVILNGNEIYYNGTFELKTPSSSYNTNIGDWGRPNIVDAENKEEYKNYVLWSSPYLQGTNVNGLSTFNILDRKELSNKFGQIYGMEQVGLTLKVYQERKSTSIYVGATELQNMDGEINLSVSNVVLGTVRQSEEDYGTIFSEGIVKNSRYVYFYDIYNQDVVRDSANGLFPISGKTQSGGYEYEYKMHTYFKNKSNALLDSITTNGADTVSVKLAYDNEYELLYVVFIDDNDSDNNDIIAFHEPSNRWITKVELFDASENYPSYLFGSDEKLYSFLNNKMWGHNSSSVARCNFYGSQKYPCVKIVTKTAPNEVKVYNSVAIHSNNLWSVDDVRIPPTYTYKNGMVSRLRSNKFQDEEGVLRAGFDRNILSTTNSTGGTISSPLSASVLTVVAFNASGFSDDDYVYVYNTTQDTYAEFTITSKVNDDVLLSVVDNIDVTDYFTVGDSCAMYLSSNVLDGERLRGYILQMKLSTTSTDETRLFKIDVDSDLT